ncbi:MAG: hydrogenase maturation protease [Syntrophomonadaceae bacterium]|nr:hydrogenase maturation protease [Syntrophomonadaceae bacterium]
MQRMILVDAVKSGLAPGTVQRIEILSNPKERFSVNWQGAELTDFFPSPRWSLTAHGLGIIETLELARLTHRLPAQIVLIGIEIECEENFRIELSREVEKAIPLAADAVQKEIQIILKNIYS